MYVVSEWRVEGNSERRRGVFMLRESHRVKAYSGVKPNRALNTSS